MTDEHKLATAITRQAQAEALLRNELLTESFTRLHDGYMKAWRETAARDTDARERLWTAVNALGKVREHLELMIRNGKLAQAEIDQLAKSRERENA